MAAGRPYVRMPETGDADPTVLFFAQNRGSETVRHAYLEIAVDGISQRVSVYDVPVGRTVSHALPLSLANLRRLGSMTLTCEVRVEGVQDHRPGDNRQQTVISWGGVEPF
jgi:hypothetical protein